MKSSETFFLLWSRWHHATDYCEKKKIDDEMVLTKFPFRLCLEKCRRANVCDQRRHIVIIQMTAVLVSISTPMDRHIQTSGRCKLQGKCFVYTSSYDLCNFDAKSLIFHTFSLTLSISSQTLNSFISLSHILIFFSWIETPFPEIVFLLFANLFDTIRFLIDLTESSTSF